VQQFIWFIDHPDQNLSLKHTNTQAFALWSFEVDDGCLYRKEDYKPNGNGSITTILQRYVVQQHNAFRFIIDIHCLLQHFGIQKTYERVIEQYYSITRNDVAWVVNRCTICNLKGAAKSSAPVTSIVASQCINHF
jgi:Integrase zinc binding domain